MKKIYMILAAMTLLTLSLNAQDGHQDADKAARAAIKNSKEMAPKPQWKANRKADTGKNAPAPTMNELLAGIKGMSSILPSIDPNGSSSQKGQMRAPLKINSDEYLVGPYTTNDFSTSGLGYPTAYGNNGQQIYLFANLVRSDFVDFDGDEIVGFRFALAGSSSDKAVLYDFHAWPYGNNGYLEAANRHTWSIPEVGGAQPVNSYDDIVITTDNGYIGFTSIIVYNGNSVVTQWVAANDEDTTPTDWTWGGTSHFASNNDGSYFMTYGSSSGGGIITIPGYLFDNCTGDIRLVISAGADSGYGSNNHQIDVNGDPKTVTNENPTFNQFTWTFSSTEALPVYMELACGQWHEFYLDEPIPFNVADSIAGMYLGYRYWQYPSTETSELLYPIAVNPNSKTHDHVSYRYGQNGTTTSTTTLTGWDYDTDGGNFPSTWTVPNHYDGEVGGYYFGSTKGANIVIPSSDLQGNSTVTVKVTAAKENSNTHTISVNNVTSSPALTTSLVELTWNNVSASSGITIHVSDFYVNISKIEIIGTATVPNYESGWWTEDFSQYGDLAVQLIFKTTGPKLITPEDGSTVDVGTNTGSGTSTTVNVSGSNLTEDLTVTVSGTGFTVSPTTISAADANAGTTITVTYNGTDPNATGTLTISSGEVTTTVNLTATCEFTPELTAPANGSTVDVGTNTGSGTSTTVTVSGSYLTQDLSVSVSGDGFTVSPTTISAADANAGTTITVTYNGTNPDATGTLTISSGEVTTTVNLSATYSESEPAFSTNGIIRMGNLIIVDQFWASTAENTHPEQYSYILRYTPAQGDPKESSPKTVDVEHVKSVVNGYYTEQDVKNDSITYNTVIVNKMTADVEMTLPNNDNKIYYVRLQGKDNDVPSEADKVNDNSDMIVKLQMTSGDGGFYYIDQLPASHPQYTPGQVNHFMDPAEPGTGSSYGDFKTYVPSVMTYGQSRRYFANDTLHNTYGAPVWRTGIGDVTIQNGMKVERQSNQWGTTQWEANGQACSLYILDNILAYGKLPNKQNSNVDYEPYMFRVFVESPSGKLRGYTPQNVYSPEKPDSIIGTELVADNSFTNFTGPICIYSEYFDGASHIDTVADATNGDYFQFTLNKNSDNWVDNAMFGGLDDIIQGEGDDLSLSDNDLKVYVRFYYRSKGSMNPSHVIRGRDGSLPHMYYGAEAKSPTPDPWTSVTEVRSHGEIIGVTYVNAQGMTSNKPFDGLNIVVTRYSDGSTTTTKVVR